MKTIVHTYDIERICKFRVGIAEFNGKLRKIDGLDPVEYKEEIIRCCDCEFFDEKGIYRDWWCNRLGLSPSKDSFCSWAEKVN